LMVHRIDMTTPAPPDMLSSCDQNIQ
jgi:hypothetical protein